ncbi:MAG: tetratricopeptide repeat protein [Sphingobium sp.]|nr:tetratricopeptide repeat protein [Sphingobium sp.]
MALTPEQSDALIREVDDAVRQDDFHSFWRNYGRLVVGAIGFALLAFGGWLLWTNHQNKAAEASSEDFAVMLKSASAATLDQANYDKLIKNGGDGYRAEAELVKAALASGKGDVKGAIASYDKMQADSSAPEPLRQLALVRRTALNFDAMQPQQVVDALKSLAVPGNPWFGSAGEMTALAYLKMNKKKEAGEMFASVNRDASVTESVRLRAGQMAGMLGISPEAIKTIDGAE